MGSRGFNDGMEEDPCVVEVPMEEDPCADKKLEEVMRVKINIFKIFLADIVVILFLIKDYINKKGAKSQGERKKQRMKFGIRNSEFGKKRQGIKELLSIVFS
jgi:hypothetical protein